MPLPNPGMSFDPFDTLPASDLNDMVENIEALEDGSAPITAISQATTAIANPYKFSATTNTQLVTGNSAFSGALVFEDEEYDTNSNYNAATGVYTAPVAGFYTFKAQLHFDAASNEIFIALFKNGTEFRRGDRDKQGAAGMSSAISVDTQLAANDTIDVRAFGANNTTDEQTVNNWFQGRLFSKT